MALSYIALLRKEPTSDFGVDFPDFPGCITAGATLEEARRLADEALAFHVEGMRADGAEIPIPSSLDQIMADPANHDAVAFLVPLVEEEPRAVRINISVPAEALLEIDEYAERHGMSRSGFLVAAARQRIRGVLTDADRPVRGTSLIRKSNKAAGLMGTQAGVHPGAARKRP